MQFPFLFSKKILLHKLHNKGSLVLNTLKFLILCLSKIFESHIWHKTFNPRVISPD